STPQRSRAALAARRSRSATRSSCTRRSTTSSPACASARHRSCSRSPWSRTASDVRDGAVTYPIVADAIEAPELAPGNARVFRIGPAIVSCLSPGAAAMVTQMENLGYLGTRRFAVVGAAGSISDDVRPGATLIPTAAVRDDGISQHYLPPVRYASPSPALGERLRRLLPAALDGATWTVPVPYRMTRRELDLHRANGVV